MLKKYFCTNVIAVVIASLFSVSAVSQAAADGITWTSRTSAADNYWFSVAYGDGLFVAVSTSGTGNRVMTSGVIGLAARTAAAAEAARVAAAAEAARVAAAAEAARVVAAEAGKKQKELTEILSLIPSIAGLALDVGDLTNTLLLKQKCVKGTKTKYVKKGAKCPKGYVRKK